MRLIRFRIKVPLIMFSVLSFTFFLIGGNTRTGDAIRYMMDRIFSVEAGSRPFVKKHMVLLTDGRSQVGAPAKPQMENLDFFFTNLQFNE